MSSAPAIHHNVDSPPPMRTYERGSARARRRVKMPPPPPPSPTARRERHTQAHTEESLRLMNVYTARTAQNAIMSTKNRRLRSTSRTARQPRAQTRRESARPPTSTYLHAGLHMSNGRPHRQCIILCASRAHRPPAALEIQSSSVVSGPEGCASSPVMSAAAAARRRTEARDAPGWARLAIDVSRTPCDSSGMFLAFERTRAGPQQWTPRWPSRRSS